MPETTTKQLLAKSAEPNYQWLCNICQQTNDGFADVEAAMADADTHYESDHKSSSAAANFEYRDLNAPQIAPDDKHDIWAQVPDGVPLEKKDLAAMFGME